MGVECDTQNEVFIFCLLKFVVVQFGCCGCNVILFVRNERTVFFTNGGFSDQVIFDMAVYLTKTGITPVVDMNMIEKYQRRYELLRCEQELRHCLIKKYPGEYQYWQFEKRYD